MNEEGTSTGRLVLITVVSFGIAFQIGHFIEHLLQAAHWLLRDRSYAWMSSLAMSLVMWLNPVMKVGMEELHLLGNLIFLLTLIGVYILIPNKYLKWAVWVETFHLWEHLSLTLSVISIGRPIGMSTLWGYVGHLPLNEAVGYRVMWHFVMNLIPSALMARGMYQQYQYKKHWVDELDVFFS